MNDMDGFVLYYIMVIIVFTMNDKNEFYLYYMYIHEVMLTNIDVNIANKM
jgi:hypothetical protein